MSEHESGSRVFSLDNFAFNFGISLEDRVRARAGAPAFALRRKRLDLTLAMFWADLDKRHRQIWLAAGEGRIGEDGREHRFNLLDADGRDRIGEESHKRRLHKEKLDYDEEQRIAYRRGFTRHLTRCGLDKVVAEVDAYNKYFPIEANLMIDPTSGMFVWMGTEWMPMEAPTEGDVLERFPGE